VINGRIRKNFADRAAAEIFCNQKNAEELSIEISHELKLTQTRLSAAEVAAAEAWVTRANGRWPLDRILEAGFSALEKARSGNPLAPFVADWLAIVQKEVDGRWFAQLRYVNTSFLEAHPALTVAEFDRVLIRKYLDSLPVSSQTKRNQRNAIHRFGSWLQERLNLTSNPAADIRIGRTVAEKQGKKFPRVFTPGQAEAWMRATETPACRRLKGWSALCTFGGVRPNSEALELTWSEINFAKREINLMGTKRGARPRVLKMNPTLFAWLKSAQADGEKVPGHYSRGLFRDAIAAANDWLAQHHPEEPAIIWEADIQRHTYASHRAGAGVQVQDLAEEMGTSPKTYYSHYKNPRTAAQVKAFWAILPSALATSKSE
jgi:integrase